MSELMGDFSCSNYAQSIVLEIFITHPMSYRGSEGGALSLYILSTVAPHRRTIMKKLNASGIADLTRLAIQEGLV
jgi:hypothetical protein